MTPPLTLTDEQKAIALANWSTNTLGELTALVFPGARPDGRSPEGKAVQSFLAGEDIHVKPAGDALPGTAQLTEEQKKLIDRLVRDDRVKTSMEMATLVFPDIKVRKLSAEWRAVYAYMKEVYPDTANTVEEPVSERDYRPPDKMTTLIGVVNTYVTTGDATRKTYNPNTLKVSEQRALKALMSYMRTVTFKYIASTYDKQTDRELFLSTFIRWAHDKADLTEMEVDQMISAASERVNVAQIEREVQDIKRYHESIMAGNETDEKTGKARKYGMVEVEQINGVRTKLDQAKGRLKTLMEGLEEVRAKRLSQRDTRNNSILNLFDAWKDDPDWRADLVAIGQREKEEDAAEVKRLRDMDDVIALISGMSEEEGAS